MIHVLCEDLTRKAHTRGIGRFHNFCLGRERVEGGNIGECLLMGELHRGRHVSGNCRREEVAQETLGWFATQYDPVAEFNDVRDLGNCFSDVPVW